MNRVISLLISTICTVLLFTNVTHAQCSFTPTINVSPFDADGIYCPNDVITLTTQSYDSYQWFYNFSNSNSGGTAWTGGSGSSIMMGASEWAVVYFYVEATDDGCTEASATVVWDAWNFLPPSISSSGQSNYCIGESTVISNAFPGPSIFQWYKDGAMIPGATMSSYTVTESGAYTLSAAYAECPSYWQSSGVGPSFTFTAPIVPMISEMDGTLSADSGISWQWIFEGVDIPGATDSDYKADLEGMYQVRVVDANGCDAISAPFQYPEGPLPIELIHFTATSNDNCTAQINWTVSEQSTAAEYYIEQSTDGRNFESLKNIDSATRTAFSENFSLTYRASYFRLRMLSLEGTVSYSQVLFVENACEDGNKNNFKIYPNPTTRIFTIENLEEQLVQMKIYNSQGKLLLQNSFQEANHSLDMQDWPKGIYQVLLDVNGNSWIRRVIKQ